MTRLGRTLASLLVLSGCMWATEPSQAPTSADRQALEARVSADATDVSAVTALATTQLLDGDAEAARSLLEPAVEQRPDDPALPLLLAVAEELSGNHVEARDRYRAYHGERIGVLAERAGARIPAVDQAARRAEVRAELARPRPPTDDDRVVVLPLAHSGGDEGAEALATAVSTLVSWDVRGDGWDTVDPVRVRIALAEMNVAPEARAELAVGLELGRRFGAGRIVQVSTTRVTLDLVSWDVTVLASEPDGRLRVEYMVLEGGLSESVRLQQRLSGMVLEALAAEVPADRRGPTHTQSATALSAYGRGLLAAERGDVDEAVRAFAVAAESDSGFAEAAEALTRMEAILAAPPVDSLVLETARVAELQRAVAALRTAPGSTHRAALTRVGGRERPIVTDALGLDVLTGGALLGVTFTAPGGP